MAPQIELIVRGLMLEQGHLLLCQNRKHSYYFLPGGHVEFGETPHAALAREFAEECGLGIRVGELMLTHDHRFNRPSGPRHEVNLVFLVEREHPPAANALTMVESREAKIAFEWVSEAKLGEIELRPAGLRAWLQDRSRRWMSEP